MRKTTDPKPTSPTPPPPPLSLSISRSLSLSKLSLWGENTMFIVKYLDTWSNLIPLNWKLFKKTSQTGFALRWPDLPPTSRPLKVGYKGCGQLWTLGMLFNVYGSYHVRRPAGQPGERTVEPDWLHLSLTMLRSWIQNKPDSNLRLSVLRSRERERERRRRRRRRGWEGGGGGGRGWKHQLEAREDTKDDTSRPH